jgi:hypothetical protein
MQIIGAMPALQNAFLRYTGLAGPLSCGLVAPPTLTRLSISGSNLTGSLPPCMLQVRTQQGLRGLQRWCWWWWWCVMELREASAAKAAASNAAASWAYPAAGCNCIDHRLHGMFHLSSQDPVA